MPEKDCENSNKCGWPNGILTTHLEKCSRQEVPLIWQQVIMEAIIVVVIDNLNHQHYRLKHRHLLIHHNKYLKATIRS